MMKTRIKVRKPGESISRAKSRYRFKPGFSERVKARSLANYRKSQGRDFELTGSVVLRALEYVDEYAKTMLVINNITAKKEHLPVLRLTNAAKLLDVSYQTLWRWTSETQQLPMPVLTDHNTGREYTVYHVEEIRIMLRIIGEHLTHFKYYRKDHETTRTAVFAEIDALRATNFEKPKGTNNDGCKKVRPRSGKSGKS